MKYIILVYGSQQDYDAARAAYLAAARRTSNLPQQRYLHARAARLTGTAE